MEEQNTATNGPAPLNVYLYAGDQIVENVTMGYFYYQDSLGNTSHVTDAVGNLLERYTYDAYGKPFFFNSTSQPLNSSTYNIRHLFQGQLWTQETGLNDYRNRVELPVMGVFLQPDPIGFKGDAANIYRFCNNNAVNRTDPTGLVNTNAGTTLEERMRLFYGSGDTGGGLYDLNVENSRTVNLAMVDQYRNGEKNKYGTSMHERSIEMLAEETQRGYISQTGAVIDGPPYRSKIVDEKLVDIDPNNRQRGKRDIGLEELKVPGKGQFYIIHYHERVGKYGIPTESHDLNMVQKYGTLYLTNKAWAAQGQYEILRRGEEPQILIDRRIIP
jgi:RHS repeat-associated protein